MFKELIDQAKTRLSGCFEHVSNVLHAPEELDEAEQVYEAALEGRIIYHDMTVKQIDPASAEGQQVIMAARLRLDEAMKVYTKTFPEKAAHLSTLGGIELSREI